MNTTLRPAYYVPAAVLLVFTSVIVALLFWSYVNPSTQQTALKLLAWTTGISAAGVSAVITSLTFMFNRQVAFRSATIEAQKMLLEINKQYMANPKLLCLEGENVAVVDQTDTTFNAQLKAMAYLKLNVFELIFAVLPGGPERETWVRYFDRSLTNSPFLADELVKNQEVYHAALMKAYNIWNSKRVGSADRKSAQPKSAAGAL
jgi:hypothetical protein